MGSCQIAATFRQLLRLPVIVRITLVARHKLTSRNCELFAVYLYLVSGFVGLGLVFALFAFGLVTLFAVFAVLGISSFLVGPIGLVVIAAERVTITVVMVIVFGFSFDTRCFAFALTTLRYPAVCVVSRFIAGFLTLRLTTTLFCGAANVISEPGRGNPVACIAQA